MDEESLDTLPEIEPPPGFAAEVLLRASRLDNLRTAVQAEEKRADATLLVALALGGGALATVLLSLLLPPLLALRLTFDATNECLRHACHLSNTAPVALALAAGAVVVLLWDPLTAWRCRRADATP